MSNLPINSESQNIGDIGEAQAALQFKKWGWTADKIQSDFGDDLACTIFTERIKTEFYFTCQIKSTSNVNEKEYIRKLKSGDFRVNISTSTLNAWRAGYFPVLLLIYDNNEDCLYWANPIEKIELNLEKLRQKTISISISKKNILKNDKSNIQKIIEAYYRKLLRFQNSELCCELYPVKMPGNKVLSLFEQRELFKDIANFELFTQDANDLPSWFSSNNLLETSSCVRGQLYRSDTKDFQLFITELKEQLSQLNFSKNQETWLSFICSPVKHILSNNQKADGWRNELSGWFNLSKINNKLCDDFNYAFELNTDFVSNKGRRASSWDNFYYLNTKLDIAIELTASRIFTTYEKKIDETMRNLVLSQVLPWEIPILQEKEFVNLIKDTEFIFKVLESKNGNYIGILCNQLFAPECNLFGFPSSWDEIEDDYILKILKNKNILEKLPGKKLEINKCKIIKEFLDKVINERQIPEKEQCINITQLHYIDGFPLNLNFRCITVHRFQMINNFNKDLINKAINSLKSRIANYIDEDSFAYNVEEIQTYKTTEDPIYDIAISWVPPLFHSSAESFGYLKDELLVFYNEVMPKSEQEYNTEHVLKYVGEIYF